MTDRFVGFVVTLEKDLREDDAEATLNAIRQIRGVLAVTPHVSTFEQHAAEMRVRAELREQLWLVLTRHEVVRETSAGC